jgi:hypothetical protein
MGFNEMWYFGVYVKIYRVILLFLYRTNIVTLLLKALTYGAIKKPLVR